MERLARANNGGLRVHISSGKPEHDLVVDETQQFVVSLFGTAKQTTLKNG